MPEDYSTQRLNAAMGVTFFLLGAVLAALVFLDRWTSIDVSFPGIWYRSRNFHVAVCVSCFLLGWLAHRNARAAAQVNDATRPIFESVRVYSRPDCKLCDQALDVIQVFSQHLPAVDVVDISGDDALEAAHGDSIPVVEIDGRIRFRGIVSGPMLERMVVARRRQLEQQAEATHSRKSSSS